MYGGLAHGSRLLGGPKRRLKDQLKRLLKKTRIPVDNWEALAAGHSTWWGTIADGVQKLETFRTQAAETEHQQRDQRFLLPRPPPTLQRPDCPQLFHSHLGLHSHPASSEEKSWNEWGEQILDPRACLSLSVTVHHCFYIFRASTFPPLPCSTYTPLPSYQLSHLHLCSLS